jgi:hypothetical protein
MPYIFITSRDPRSGRTNIKFVHRRRAGALGRGPDTVLREAIGLTEPQLIQFRDKIKRDFSLKE